MKHVLKYQVPPWFMAVTIFIFSAQPNVAMPDLGFDLQDKLYHMAAYTVFGFLVSRGWFAGREANARLAWLPWLIAVLFAASDEWHQSFVPGRFADIYDFLADAAGVTLGVIIRIRLKVNSALGRFFC